MGGRGRPGQRMPSGTYYLRNLGLLDGLPEGAGRILDQHLRVQRFGRHEVIFEQGGLAERIYLLIQGTVELARCEDGKEVTLLMLTAGELIAGPAQDAASGYPARARALAECVVCSIGCRELDSAAQALPALAWRILVLSNRNTAEAYARIHSLASCEVPDKLLALIRHLARRHGVPTEEGLRISMRLTHNELATLIGSCREAVSRGLKALRDRGLISISARQITLRAV